MVKLNKISRAVILFFLAAIMGMAIFLFIFTFNQDNSYIVNDDSASRTKEIFLVTDNREDDNDNNVDPNFIKKFTSDNIHIGKYGGDYIFLRFDNKINGNESLENFRKYLKKKSTVIYINYGSGVITEFDKAVRDNMHIQLNSYENGRLKGVLTTKAQNASRQIINNSDPNCITGDMMGICYHDSKINVNLIINFEVQIK